jgi:hypothetical protein
MKSDKHTASIQEGIERLNESLNPDLGINVDRCVTLIEDGKGDPWACKSTLERFSIIKSMLAWFEGRDLVGMKNWAFNAAKLRRAMYQERSTGTYYTPIHLMPLLSDDVSMIDWFCRFDLPFSLTRDTQMGSRTNNPNMVDYYHYNTWLAVRGDWERLKDRSLRFLAAVPAKHASHEADHRFHLALANGDMQGMEAALAEIVDPKLMRRRRAEEGANTQYFICMYAVVYAKIAWRYGYQVKVDSPWVPKEWLPIAPLPKYEDAFAFMAGLNDSMPVDDASVKAQ